MLPIPGIPKNRLHAFIPFFVRPHRNDGLASYPCRQMIRQGINQLLRSGGAFFLFPDFLLARLGPVLHHFPGRRLIDHVQRMIALAQSHHVADHIGECGLGKDRVRQTHGADQFRLIVQPDAKGPMLRHVRIQQIAGHHHNGQSTGAQPVHAFGEKISVGIGRHLGQIGARHIQQFALAEGWIAHHHVHGFRKLHFLERRVVDFFPGMQGFRHGGRDRVHLHGQKFHRHIRREAEKYAAAHRWFQYLQRVLRVGQNLRQCLTYCVPNSRYHGVGGVLRVHGARAQGFHLIFGGQRFQFQDDIGPAGRNLSVGPAKTVGQAAEAIKQGDLLLFFR